MTVCQIKWTMDWKNKSDIGIVRKDYIQATIWIHSSTPTRIRGTLNKGTPEITLASALCFPQQAPLHPHRPL